MRLRSDLQAYLEELRERSAHDSELSKIVEAHFNSQKPDDGSREAMKNLENELENTRLTYSQLLHNHNKLRGDHHKLICKFCTVNIFGSKSGHLCNRIIGRFLFILSKIFAVFDDFSKWRVPNV